MKSFIISLHHFLFSWCLSFRFLFLFRISKQNSRKFRGLESRKQETKYLAWYLLGEFTRKSTPECVHDVRWDILMNNIRWIQIAFQIWMGFIIYLMHRECGSLPSIEIERCDDSGYLSLVCSHFSIQTIRIPKKMNKSFWNPNKCGKLSECHSWVF